MIHMQGLTASLGGGMPSATKDGYVIDAQSAHGTEQPVRTGDGLMEHENYPTDATHSGNP